MQLRSSVLFRTCVSRFGRTGRACLAENREQLGCGPGGRNALRSCRRQSWQARQYSDTVLAKQISIDIGVPGAGAGPTLQNDGGTGL